MLAALEGLIGKHGLDSGRGGRGLTAAVVVRWEYPDDPEPDRFVMATGDREISADMLSHGAFGLRGRGKRRASFPTKAFSFLPVGLARVEKPLESSLTDIDRLGAHWPTFLRGHVSHRGAVLLGRRTAVDTVAAQLLDAALRVVGRHRAGHGLRCVILSQASRINLCRTTP